LSLYFARTRKSRRAHPAKSRSDYRKSNRYNVEEASRLYAERYPNRHHPYPPAFRRLDNRMRTENCLKPKGAGGRFRGIRNPENEEDILAQVEEDPTTSCRKIARVTGILKSTVNRVLRLHHFHPYHFTAVQNLHPGDRELRMQFCREFLELHNQDANFLTNLLWTDKSLFTREGTFNQHNFHYYAEENPFVTRPRSYQHRWKVNVWGGIVGDHVMIHLLPDVLNVSSYTHTYTHILRLA